MNRTKTLVLGLFAVYWVIVVATLVVAPEFYESQLPPALRQANNPLPAELGTLLALTVLLGVLSAGVIRNWRWTFWLIVVVFLAGILHVPAAVPQIAGIFALRSPAWYVVFQAVVGLIQFCIALVMLIGYRGAGMWGRW